MLIENLVYMCKRYKSDYHKREWAKTFLCFSVIYLILSFSRQHILFHFRVFILTQKYVFFFLPCRTQISSQSLTSLKFSHFALNALSFGIYLAYPNLKCFLFALLSMVVLGWHPHNVPQRQVSYSISFLSQLHTCQVFQLIFPHHM